MRAWEAELAYDPDRVGVDELQSLHGSLLKSSSLAHYTI